MNKEEKKVAKKVAIEQAKEDKKASKQWNDFIRRMKLKKALIENIK